MPFKDKLLARWKWFLSFLKREWELNDYPVVVREQPSPTGPEPHPSRYVPPRYLARIVYWGVMTGGGETPTQAMADLVSEFARVKDSSLIKGHRMPRPGKRPPVVFASSDRVSADPTLRDCFIQHVLGLKWAFVSDESSLWDFHTELTNEALNERIRAIYGVDVSDLESGNLADIFDRITKQGS